MDEKSDEGRVVYSRPGEADGDAGAPAPRRARGWPSSVGRDSLWKALVPLLVGFVLLIALVLGLGLMSRREVERISFDTRDDERRLSLMTGTVLSLRMTLGRLVAEARIRAKIEAGTANVMQ